MPEPFQVDLPGAISPTAHIGDAGMAENGLKHMDRFLDILRASFLLRPGVLPNIYLAIPAISEKIGLVKMRFHSPQVFLILAHLNVFQLLNRGRQIHNEIAAPDIAQRVDDVLHDCKLFPVNRGVHGDLPCAFS